MKKLFLVAAFALFLSGCAAGACNYNAGKDSVGKDIISCTGAVGMIHELKDDPTVGWFTGFFLNLGISGSGVSGTAAPTPASANAPYTPHVTLGYGTIGRVGVHDEVVITVGGSGAIQGQSQGTTQIPSLSGMSSMFIRARNCGAAHNCTPQDTESAKDAANPPPPMAPDSTLKEK